MPRLYQHPPPFVVKLLHSGKYHLVKETDAGYYVTCCGLRINYGTLDDQPATEVARKTMLRKQDFIRTFRVPCGHCAGTEFWQDEWVPNINYKIVN